MNMNPESRLIGYARVSTNGQELNLQLDALLKAGCAKKNIFTDRVSGAKASRPGLDACLQKLKSGDTLMVWRIDRLGRSMRHLVNLVDDLRQRGVGFKSLNDGIDTTTANGEMVFGLFATLAQFERRLVQERTKAGLESARARGRVGGRPPISPDDPRVRTAKEMHAAKAMPVMDICRTLRISRPTFYRYLAMSSSVSERDGTARAVRV